MAGDADGSPPEPIKAAPKGPGTFVKGLYIGVATASCGGLMSALIATLKNNPRSRLYVVGTTLNCFILGTGYYVTREVFSQKVFAYPQDEKITNRQKIMLSGASAAAVGGSWGAIIGGRRHAFPGLIVFGLAGLGGQAALNAMEASRQRAGLDANTEASAEAPKKEGIISRFLNAENSPIRRLTREEYIAKMRDKQLIIDAEIALIDEEIERLEKRLEEENAGKNE